MVNERGFQKMIIGEKFRGTNIIKRSGCVKEIVLDPSLITEVSNNTVLKPSTLEINKETAQLIMKPASIGTLIATDMIGITEEVVLQGLTIGDDGMLLELISGGIHFLDGGKAYYLTANGRCVFDPDVTNATPETSGSNVWNINRTRRIRWVNVKTIRGSVERMLSDKYAVFKTSDGGKHFRRDYAPSADNVLFEVVLDFQKDRGVTRAIDDKYGWWCLCTYILNIYPDLGLEKYVYTDPIKEDKSSDFLNYKRTKEDEDYDESFDIIPVEEELKIVNEFVNDDFGD